MTNLTRPQEYMLQEMIDAIINPTPYSVGMLTGKGELLCQRLVEKGMMEKSDPILGSFSISAAGWYYAVEHFGLQWRTN